MTSTRTIVRITDDTTRADLAVTIAIQCEAAKAISRRGYTGTRGAEYRIVHERIDVLLGDWLAAATCRTCGLSRARCDKAPSCCVVCRHE